MKKNSTGISLLVLAVFIVVNVAADLSAEKRKVRIAIAANLIPVMSEIEKLYEKENPDTDIEVISGPSGNLTTQIMNGAPFDIFASADMDYPAKLKDRGLTIAGPDIYAEGFLVLFTVKKIDLSKGINAVTDKQVEKISVANPDVAPYGRAAVDALKKAGLYSGVEKKIVYAGNISQAAQQVITGSDIGFVARSLLFDQAMLMYKENKNWINIPENLAPPLKQGVVLLSKSSGNKDAEKFYRFILSKKVRPVFAKYGYK